MTKRIHAWAVVDNDNDFDIPDEQLSIYDSKESAEFFYHDELKDEMVKVVPCEIVIKEKRK